MAETQHTVARLVFGGAVLSPGGQPIEIWATGVHLGTKPVAGRAQSTDADFSQLQEETYLDANAVPACTALMVGVGARYRLDYVKVNRFHVERRTTLKQPNGFWTAIQTEPLTHLRDGLGVIGGSPDSRLPLDTCQGFSFSTTLQTRGRASVGRMFLPPFGGITITAGRFDNVQGDPRAPFMGEFLRGLTKATADAATTILPVLAALPSTKTAGGPAEWLVNAVDRYLVEDIPFVQRKRKSALKGQGARQPIPA